MELCTALFYTHLSRFILPQNKTVFEQSLPLIKVTARMSTLNRFTERVLEETVFTAPNQFSEYTVPADNMSHASAMGIAMGMLKAMKVDAKAFGQSRLGGLAYVLVMDKAVRRRARRIRAGDNFKLVIDKTGHIHLNINQSRARTRARLFANRMSLRPKLKVRTAFIIGNAASYVQQVAQKSTVRAEAQQVEYIVHDDDIPNASAMGTALGMLHALKVESRDFGQSRLEGLALKLVLRKEIRRQARSFHKGDRFLIQASNEGKITLNIYTGLNQKNSKPFKSNDLNKVIAQEKVLDQVVTENEEDKELLEEEALDKASTDQQLAAFSQDSEFSQEKVNEKDLDAAFKPENIIKNNITSIVNETVTGLKLSTEAAKPLRKDLETFLTSWSQKAKKVDKSFLTDFVSVIAQDLTKKPKDKASQDKIKLSLLAGLKEEHDFYDTKEEALLETAKQILLTVKELKAAKKK